MLQQYFLTGIYFNGNKGVKDDQQEHSIIPLFNYIKCVYYAIIHFVDNIHN